MKIIVFILLLFTLGGCLVKKPDVPDSIVYEISFSGAPVYDDLSNTVTFKVNYKNAKSISLVNANVTLVKTGTLTGIANVSGDGLESRTITVSDLNGVGTIAVSIAGGTALYSKTISAKAIGPSAAYTMVHTPPAITISTPSPARSASGPVSFTVNYTNATAVVLDSSFITLVKTGTADAVFSVTGSGFSRTVTLSSMTGSGTIGFSIATDSALSSTGIYSSSTSSLVPVTVDNAPPVISFSSPSASISSAGPVSYTVSYTEQPAISLTTGKITLNKTGTADGVVSVSGSGNLQRTVSISSLSGNGTLGISLAANTAVDDVGNVSLAAGPSTTFTVDTIPPTFTVSAPSVTVTNSGPVTYNVSYTGASSVTLTSSNIVLNKTGTANATVAVSGTGSTTRTVTLSSITGDGTLGFTIGANTATDSAGNYAVAGSASGTFNVDNTASGISFSAPSLATTNNGTVTFTVTYSDAASISLIDSDVILNKTGTANGTATVTGSGSTTRTITITGVTGNGTIGVKLAAGTAIDTSGNLALASGSSSNFIVDNVRPTLAISAPSALISKTGPITYTITYSGATAISLAAGNITLNKTGTADGLVAVTGTGITTRTVTISGITGDGTLGISLAAATATDDAGNASLASSASTTFAADNTPPPISIGTPSKLGTTSGPVTYTITYSGASAVSLTSANVTLNKTGSANGTVAVSGSGTTTRVVTISGVTGNGSLGISIAAGTAVDVAGNSAISPSASSTVYVTDDPLFSFSWHLYNYGQTSFSTGAGFAGYDLNILGSYKNGFKGAGINVLVSDTGVEATHEDLAANYLSGSVSVDFVNGTTPSFLNSTALPDYTDAESFHGTSVAGLIAAASGNGLGGQGVAPSAKIASANFLRSGGTLTEELAQIDGNFSIINQSWGYSQCAITTPDAAYEAKMKTDRKIYIKSAGNSFDQAMNECGGPNVMRHGSSVVDAMDNNPYMIIVAAMNARGLKSSYSSPGSNIWITGMGGEYGDTAPAMITTDLGGCTYGSSPAFAYNSFQLSSHPLNTQCKYTSVMNGTSSAAPILSGVVAMLLSANNTLTARDVKHILATTARKINPTAGATVNAYATALSGHVWQQGWVTNAAGYPFHNYYGFGLADVDAAVAMATGGYSALPVEVQTNYVNSGTVNLAIPDNSATGVQSSITTASTLTVEAIQIKTHITHADIGQLGIEVTSPSGTKSIILNINNSLLGLADFSNEVFLSNAFYGETATGIWKVKIIDGLSGTTGTLHDWDLNIIGH
ncbi:MAG: S8 family serine peptidase [Rhizobacter sp.]|nr:S8 family serine peptidase [Bacteriovorax sp.]